MTARGQQYEDRAPRVVEKGKKPEVKLYEDYEEELEKEGDGWILKGYFGEQAYEIPVRQKYRFGAVAARYRLLLKGERDTQDQRTGQTFPGDNRAAQFNEGRYDSRDMFEVRAIYRSNAFVNGRVWDMDIEEAKARETNYSAMRDILMGDSEFKERFIAEMKAELKKQEAPAKVQKEA